MKKTRKIYNSFLSEKLNARVLRDETSSLVSTTMASEKLASSYHDVVAMIDEQIFTFECKQSRWNEGTRKSYLDYHNLAGKENFNPYWLRKQTCNRDCSSFCGNKHTLWQSVDEAISKINDKLEYQLDFSEKFYYSLSTSASSNGAARIKELNEELRNLRADLRTSHFSKVLLRIKKLVQELHTLISYHYKLQRTFVRNITRLFLKTVTIDIRLRFRSIIRFLFKCLSDISGCDEAASTSENSRRNSFYNQKIRNNAINTTTNFKARRNYCLA